MTKRDFISLERKVYLAKAGKMTLETGGSLRLLCRENNIQGNQIRKYMNSIHLMEDRLNGSTRGTAGLKSMSKGRPSSIKAIELELLEWVLCLRHEGMPVSMNMVVVRGSQLLENFRRKNYRTRYQIVRRFLKSKNMVVRSSTHEAQRAPQEMKDDAIKFLVRVRPLLTCCNRDKNFILNMDQTPVFFSMTPNTTVNVRGARTVNVRKSSGSTQRLTVAVAVTAAGKFLKPMIVFKGKPGGRIEKKELPTLSDRCLYGVQQKAWMSERLCLRWVEEVLKPWAEEAPEHVVPYLLLDSYPCHLMKSMTHAIQALGVEIEHVPGGCTGLAQPVDVGINKPLKCHIRRYWEEYMINTGLQQMVTKAPSRAMMASWCIDGLDAIDSNIGKNAWLHKDYSFFPREETIPVEECLELTEEDEMVEESLESTEDQMAEIGKQMAEMMDDSASEESLELTENDMAEMRDVSAPL